jgi:hypothetical protein
MNPQAAAEVIVSGWSATACVDLRLIMQSND